MSLKKAIVLGIVLGLAGCEGKAGAQAAAAAPKGATSARACAEAVVQCMKKGDLVGVAAYFTEPTRGRLAKMASGMAAVAAAHEKLVAAVDAKFGAGTAEKAGISVPRVPSGEKIEIAEVKETGDTAVVTTREGETTDTLPLVKKDGAWFVSPPKDHPEFGEETFAEIDTRYPQIVAQGKAVEALAAEVAGGKVAQADVQGRYREAVRNAMGR